MKQEAPKLSQLIGLPLKISRHAANMLVLHFGKIRRSVGKYGPESFGYLALHVQCPWRVSSGDELLFGSADRWHPIAEVKDWDAWWESPHPSKEDAGWEKLLGGTDASTNSFEAPRDSLVVTEVRPGVFGDLRIVFSSGVVMDVFANDGNHELWRLLEPGNDSAHLVTSAKHRDEKE